MLDRSVGLLTTLDSDGLLERRGVTRKKATDKMVDIIKQYNDLRHTIEHPEWVTGLDGLGGTPHKDRDLMRNREKKLTLKRLRMLLSIRRAILRSSKIGKADDSSGQTPPVYS